MKYMTTSEFSSYKFEDTVASELHNNILIVNNIIKNKMLKAKPQFYILGGAALVLHNLNYQSTLDIDTANRIESSIREDVSLFIDDAASGVTCLGSGYEYRAIRYCKDELPYIEVFLLSYEDLLLTKVSSGRRKDYNSIIASGLLKQADLNKTKDILYHEYTEHDRRKIIMSAKLISIDWS